MHKNAEKQKNQRKLLNIMQKRCMIMRNSIL